MVFLFSDTGTPGLGMQKLLQWSLPMCSQQPQMYRYVLLHDCNNTVEIESDVESDDRHDESDRHGDSDANDDEEDI